MFRTPRSQRPRNSAGITARRLPAKVNLRVSPQPSCLTGEIPSPPNLRNGLMKSHVRYSCYFTLAKQIQSRTCAAMFSTLCYVEADTTKLCATLKPQFGVGRRTKFYEIKYDVVLTLGLTELRAHISWEDQYVSRRINYLDEFD